MRVHFVTSFVIPHFKGVFLNAYCRNASQMITSTKLIMKNNKLDYQKIINSIKKIFVSVKTDVKVKWSVMDYITLEGNFELVCLVHVSIIPTECQFMLCYCK